MHPGQCWAFRGSEGFLVIQLAARVSVSAFSYEHIPQRISPSGSVDSAPKAFSVFGLTDENDTEGTLLGNFEYQVRKDPFGALNVVECGNVCVWKCVCVFYPCVCLLWFIERMNDSTSVSVSEGVMQWVNACVRLVILCSFLGQSVLENCHFVILRFRQIRRSCFTSSLNHSLTHRITLTIWITHRSIHSLIHLITPSLLESLPHSSNHSLTPLITPSLI